MVLRGRRQYTRCWGITAELLGLYIVVVAGHERPSTVAAVQTLGSGGMRTELVLWAIVSDQWSGKRTAHGMWHHSGSAGPIGDAGHMSLRVDRGGRAARRCKEKVRMLELIMYGLIGLARNARYSVLFLYTPMNSHRSEKRSSFDLINSANLNDCQRIETEYRDSTVPGDGW